MRECTNKISIFFVIDGLTFGGGERVFSQIINGLSYEKYCLSLGSTPNKQFNNSINSNSVRYFPLDFTKKISLSLIIKISHIIKRNNIQIVHGQGSRAEFHARLACKLAGNSKYVSTIAMPVEGFDVSFLRKRIYRFFDYLSENYVNRFIVVSDVLKHMLINNRGLPPDKVTRIFNGIEIDNYSPDVDGRARNKIREGFKISKGTILIGAVGRLVWQKGFEYLIQAIPGIQNEFSNIKVLIVGDGPLNNKLKAQSLKLNVQNHLIFTGFRNDIKEVLSAIDILVIPSLLEGFPMITLEAMAMAKPLIATEIDGIKEQIIDGDSGILIPPCNPKAIAGAVIKLTHDKELAVKMGKKARRKVVAEFSVIKMVAETEKVYQSLISEHI